MTDDFAALGLCERTLQAVESAGYSKPTDIQAKAIPQVLAGQDLIGLAQTGTGKTAAFTLPILSRLAGGRVRARMPRTLILEPTRELAAQVENTIKALDPEQKVSMALLIGGVSFEPQDAKLARGVDILIATPGRLLDHFSRGKLLMSGVEFFVIDEADRMLDMGFIPDIEKIGKLLPVRRQTLCFSATMPDEISRLTQNFLQDPVTVQVAPTSATADTIDQRCIHAPIEPKDKRDVLRSVMRDSGTIQNAIVFCNRKRDVGIVANSLRKHGFSASALHGDMDQRARMETLSAFKDSKIQVMVASDVAARGLDIPAVSHVFNYDVPTHPEDYVHRIGRTGRAGRSGQAVTLITPKDDELWAKVSRLIDKNLPFIESQAVSGKPSKKRPSESADANNKKQTRSSSRPDKVKSKATTANANGSQDQKSLDRDELDNDMAQGFGHDSNIPDFMTVSLKR